MKREKSGAPQIINILLSILAVLVLLPGSLFAPAQVAQADSTPVGDVIFNYPFDVSKPPQNIEEAFDWTVFDHADGEHGGYDIAYTQSGSASMNGVATPSHVVFVNSVSGKIEPGLNNSIAFYGYAMPPYMDYVFADRGPTTGSAFIMRPLWMNFHTFSESGYFFNGQIDNGYYTGYAVVLQCGNSSGMLEGDHSQPNTAALRLYYLDHERWDTEQFSPGSVARGNRTLIATYITGITDINAGPEASNTPYRVEVAIDPLTRAFDVSVNGSLRTSVSATDVIGGPGGPYGFGFYTGYYEHDCSRLTRMRFEEITADIDPIPVVSTPATVRFVKQGTDIELRQAETENGYIGQGYRIVQPQRLTVDGAEYHLVENSRGTSLWSDIQSMYRNTDSNPDINVTTLYYINPAEQATPPDKTARVAGEAWDNGAVDSPVYVLAGNTIEYDITLHAQCTAMMHNRFPLAFKDIGPNDERVYGCYIYNDTVDDLVPVGRNSAWIGGAGECRTDYAYDKVTVVKLAKNITCEADFLDIVGDEWNGKEILAYWDFTETDPTYNPNADSSKVYVWVTKSDRGDDRDLNGFSAIFYDMFVGGGGGVIMSPARLDYNLLDYTIELDDSDPDNPMALELTPYGVYNQWGVFGLCFDSASEMNLGWLDTSRVTDFRRMFAASMVSGRTHKILDLSSFVFADGASWDSDMLAVLGLGLNRNSRIIVGGQEAKDWLQTRFGTAMPFADYNSATDSGILVSPTGSPTDIKVTDTVPDGLTIDESSITNGEGISYTLTGNTIVWTVSAGKLPVDLIVKATVDLSNTDGTDFINTASVDFGGYVADTGNTYHRFLEGFLVTEQYLIYDNGPTTTKLSADLVTVVMSGDGYSVLGPLTELGGYGYYGYSLDGGLTVIQGAPPKPTFDSVYQNKQLQLYYQRPGGFSTVTVHFVDENGSSLKAERVEPVFLHSDFYLPQSCLGSFNDDVTTWTYYDYRLTDTVGVANQPLPVSPIYPVTADSSGPLPTFADVVENQHVTLYFTSGRAVTVRFVEYGNASHVLHNSEVYFLDTTFDPSAALRHDGAGSTVGLAADIDMLGELGKVYKYSAHYSINDGSLLDGLPGTQANPCEITLYFETTWTVRELFVAYSYNAATGDYSVVVFNELERNHADLPGGSAFYALGDPAAALPSIPGYRYVGYQFERIQNPLIGGAPTAPLLDEVYADYVIIYVYEADGAPAAGSLRITKTLVGSGVEPSRDFHFRVTFGDGGTYGGVASGSQIVLKGGQSAVISGIPLGVTYSVVEIEANKDGYTTTSTGTSGTIGPVRSEASFVNRKNAPTLPATGDVGGVAGVVVAMLLLVAGASCVLTKRKRLRA